MTRAEELTLKLIDGDLSEAEWEELDALVLTDPAAEAAHLALLDLEAVLRGLRADLDIVDAAMTRVKDTLAGRTTAAVMAEIAALPPPKWAPRPAAGPARRPGRRRALFAALAAAAVAAGAVVGVWTDPPAGRPAADPGPAPSPSYPTVTSVLGSVELVTPGGEATPARPGRPVVPGQTLRTVGEDSLAVVELPDHTRFEMEPDTTVRFPASPGGDGWGWLVVLAQGQLRADVPDRPAGRPMVISTASADVVTRGAAFVVSSAAPGSARVESLRGSVQVARAAAPRGVSVAAGGAAVVQPWFERVAVEPQPWVRATPRRVLSVEAYPGARAAAFAPDAREIWAVNCRMLVRWTPDGGTAEVPFLPKKGGDGLAAVVSPDRTAVLTFRGDKDDSLVVRDLPDGAVRATIPRIADARFAALAPAGAWVAAVQPKPNHKRVTVWDGTTGAVRFGRDLEEGANCLAAAAAGDALAVGVTDSGKGAHNKVVVFDPVTGDRRFALPTQRRGVTALAFSADGRFLAAGFNGVVQLWDVRSRDLVRSVTGFERAVVRLAFSPDGRRLAGGTQDGQVWVWGVGTGNTVQRLDLGGRAVRSVCFSPDGRSLLTAAVRAPVAVWALPAETPADRDEQ